MELIKSVILIGCVMGIISTFSDIAAPEGSLKKQLNLILGLILVLVVITPFLGNEFRISLRDYSLKSKTEALDLSGYTNDALINSANKKIEEYFLDKLNKNSITEADVDIYSEINEYNEIKIKRIDVFTESSFDEEKVKKLISEDLPETEINVKIKEGENEHR